MSCKSHLEIFTATINGGESKTKQSPFSALMLTMLAGAYIAIGAFLALKAGAGFPYENWGALGKLLFGAVFPLGLMLVLICGADLFTGNCMSLGSAAYVRRISGIAALKHGIFSWTGNFLGALFVAYFIAYQSGLIFETVTVGGEKTMPWASSIVQIANTKGHLAFGEAFWRGVGCNWLVCLAVYAATASDTVSGKILALWVPTMAFVALGMEHCIANMFFIPLGMLTGTHPLYMELVAAGHASSLSTGLSDFFVGNLIPVTLGNIAGGSLLVAGVYTWAHHRKKKGSA